MKNGKKLSINKLLGNKLIGLTGKYCAGKNHVALLLEQRSIPVLDVDKLGHDVIEKERERILSRFGEDILGSDGLIDRRQLGDKVFGKPDELSALEGIIHPAVNRETLAWIGEHGGKACAINAALLHRSSAFEMLDAVIVVRAPFITRLLRAKKRDKMPLNALLKRFGSQRGFDYQSRVAVPKTEVFGQPQLFKKKSDIYIVENYAHSNLEKRINEILSDIFAI